MEPSPLEISNLRLRLRAMKRGSYDWQELSAILDEIAEIGPHSGQLIPDVVSAMKRGVYIPAISVVPVIARLKSVELLNAALEQNEGNWPLNTFERCELLEGGFLQFQEPLLAELFQIFELDTEPRRSAIVEALSVSGTASAIETLRVIEHRTAARIPELVAELPAGDRATQVRIMMERGDIIGVRKQFLKQIRQAIQLISNRSHSQDTALDSQAIEENLSRPIGEGLRNPAPILAGALVGRESVPFPAKTSLHYRQATPA